MSLFLVRIYVWFSLLGMILGVHTLECCELVKFEGKVGFSYYKIKIYQNPKKKLLFQYWKK